MTRRDAGDGRTVAKSAAATLPALGVSAAGGVLVLSLAGRTLGPAGFASFLAFWAVLFGLFGVVLTLEQEAARVTSQRGAGHAVGQVLPVAVALALGLTAAAAPLLPRLAGDGRGELLGIVGVAVVGMAVQGTLRGTLLVRGKAGQYVALVVGETALRLVPVALLSSRGVGIVGLAACTALGSFAWLAWLPGARTAVVRWAWPGLPQLRTGAQLATSGVCASMLITGFPALATALTSPGRAAQLGLVLSAGTLGRAPLVIFSPVQALLVPTFLSTRTPGLAHAKALLGVAAVGAGCTAAAAAVGPAVLAWMYGARFSVTPSVLVALVLSSVVMAALFASNAALLALGAHRMVAATWVVALTVTIGVLMLDHRPPTWAIPSALLLGATAGELLAAAAVGRTVRRSRS